MLLRQIIQDASGEFRDTRKNAHANVVTMKYVIMNRNKYISDFWKTVFYFALFAVQLHMGMVYNDYMPETFATSEKQRNNFAFDEEKEKHV